MGDRGKTRYSLASSLTDRGFCTFIPDLVDGLRRVYILKGAPGSGKSTFIRLVGETLSGQGYDVEYWVSSLDPVAPDGVYIPQLDAAVVNGSLAVPLDPQYPQVREIMINLDEYIRGGIAAENFPVITGLLDCIKAGREQAVRRLQEAAETHDEMRRFNAGQLDLDGIRSLIGAISDRSMGYPPMERHYFARVITPEGMADYIDDASSECRQRYIFKGPPGSGGQLVITGLAERGRQQGYALEYYHCGLEYDQLVMVIVRNLQVAFIETDRAATEPRQGDIMVDMQGYLNKGRSGPVSLESSETGRHYESLRHKIQQDLTAVQKKIRAVKRYYSEAMDFAGLDQRRSEVINDILKLR